MQVHIYFKVMLTIGALLYGIAILMGSTFVPMRFIGFGLMTAGYISVLSRMGLEKPLNLLALVCWSYGTLGHSLWCLNANPDAAMLFVLGCTLSIFLLSAAALHRPGRIAQLGAFGAATSLLAIATLVGGHIALGGFGVLMSGVAAGSINIVFAETALCILIGGLGGSLFLVDSKK